MNETAENSNIINHSGERYNLSGEGYLIVKVFTAYGAVPIENARVIVYRTESKRKNKILYSLKTNEKGSTEKISLTAPGQPEITALKYPQPYILYNIDIYKHGYFGIKNAKAPVFENVTSIQTIDIPPHRKGKIKKAR